MTTVRPGLSFGMVLIIIVVALISVIAAFRQGWLTPHSSLHLVLNSNPSLAPGVPVKIKGFAIGRVDQVDLDDKGLVHVRLRVDTHYLPLIAKDASVKLTREGLIGAAYLEFSGGSDGGTRVAEGDTVAFDPGIDWGAQAGVILPQIKDVVGNLKLVTDEVAAARADLRETAAHLAAVSRTADERSRPILAHVDASLQHVEATTATAQALASTANARIPDLLASTKATLASVQGSLDKAQTSVNNVNAMTGKLRETLDQAQPDAVRALRNGRAASEDAAAVLSGVRGSPLYRTVVSEPAATPDAAPLDAYEDRSPR